MRSEGTLFTVFPPPQAAPDGYMRFVTPSGAEGLSWYLQKKANTPRHARKIALSIFATKINLHAGNYAISGILFRNYTRLGTLVV